MRNYRKRTLALILASAITVVGSFAAENYRNTLMQIDFQQSKNGVTTAILSTKTDYLNEVELSEISPNTYVAVLPETDNSAKVPEINNDIQSVDIKTMPYTTEAKGYTKITVKTLPDVRLVTKTQLFIAQNPMSKSKDLNNISQEQNTIEQPVQEKTQNDSDITPTNNETYRTKSMQIGSKNTKAKTKKAKKSTVNSSGFDLAQIFPYAFGSIIIFFLLVLLYMKGKKKMEDLVGGSSDYDFDSEESKDKKNEKNKPTVKKTEKRKQKIELPDNNVNMITGQISNLPPVEEKVPAEDEDTPISVDLDELYKQTNNNDTKENNDEVIETEKPSEEIDDLASFLDEFSFEDEINAQEVIEEAEEELYNDELYKEVMKEDNIVFSKSDIKKIKQLLEQELNNDVIDEVKNYVSNPAPPKKTKEQILENFVLDYRIKQNITFSHEDIEILRKLISVEIDESFITDLETNVSAAKIVDNGEGKIFAELKKPAPVKILKVGNELPNLEAELKKLSGQKIESNAKPQVIYYSEGYDVDILSTNNELANINFEIGNKNEYRPSDKVSIMAEEFDVDELHVPTIKLEPPKEQIISNKTEIIQKEAKPKQEELSDNKKELKTDKSSVIKNENNISGIQKTPITEKDKKPVIKNENNNISQISKNKVNTQNTNPKQKKLQLENKYQQEILKNISTKPAQVSVKPKAENNPVKVVQKIEKCIINNQEYTILSDYTISENQGLYLVQNNQDYYVMGYKDKKFFELKKYNDLKSTKIQGRLSEKLENGTLQYIIRIGMKKFIVNITDTTMEYVMELC